MPVSAAPERMLRFDTFELNIRAGELRKRGVKLRLQGQPLLVLTTLLERAGELVTREELRDQIWPADTFVDFDHSLHNAVARIRAVLGDSAETPRYIETLPRRGYRFIGKMEAVGNPAIATAVPSASSVQAPLEVKSGSKGRIPWVFAVLTVVVTGLSLAAMRMASHGAGVELPLRSIAVLPLDNLSGDPSQDFFVDGMTEELTTDLAKVTSLRVTSRTSAMRYKGIKKKGLPEIARELNVDGIVEGSVTRSGQRIRITAQLLHAPTDRHLWAETYERDLGDMLKLQSEVAQAIAQQVRAQVTPQQQAQLRSAPSVNPEAYEAYLRGKYYMTNQFSTPHQLNLAKGYFEESIQKDPNLALAYAGLADSYLYLAFFRQLSPQVAYGPAKAAVEKALSLDHGIGEAHDTLAALSWRFEWDWAATERELNLAVTRAPSYSCAHEDRSEYLSLTGRRDEAMAELAKSRELDPGPSFSLTELGNYYQLRDYPALVEASRRGLVSDPQEWLEHYYLGIGYEGTGKKLEAVSEYQKAVELSNGDDDARSSLAHAYVLIGRQAEAEGILRILTQRSKNTYVSPYILATVYAGLGKRDKALEFLEKAFRERSLEVTWEIKADLRLDTLRSDPRFQNLIRRIGIPEQGRS